MIEQRRLSARIPLILLLGLLGLPAPPSPASAQTGSPSVDLEALSRDRKAKAMRYPLHRRISRYTSAAAERVDEGKPEEAVALLLRLDPDRLNPYERALVYRMLGYVAYGNQEPEKAVGWFEKVLAEEVLPLRDESKLRFGIAQLHAGLEHWALTVEWVDAWLRYDAYPDPLGFYLKAIAQYQLEDFDAAIAAGARVAVLPCCHSLAKCDSGGVAGWVDGPLAIDMTRAARLRAAGYRVHTQTIPSDISPKNRLLLGDSRA